MKKFLCVLLAAMMIIGCASAMADEKIKLQIYGQYADDDTKVPYDYAVEKLAEAYPNVELELIPQAQDDGATLLALATAGKLPDIYQTGSGIVTTLRNSKQMMVLNDVAEKTGFLDKVYATEKQFMFADDGNIYAFPYAGQEYVLWFVNKALFAQYNLEIPTTYDELIACADVFNANGIVPMALFGQEGWISAAMYDAVATRYINAGIKGIDNGTTSIEDEAYLKAAEKLAELAKAGVFQAAVTTTNYDQASEMFLGGKAAMFLNGQWYIEDATKALGDDVAWIAYPSYDAASYEANKHAFSGGGGSISGYAVNPASPNAELAAEVAAFISEKYCEAKVMLRNNPLVAVDTGLVNENFPPMMQALVAEMPNMTSTTAFTWGLTNTTWSNAIGVAGQSLLSGQFTAQEVIDQLVFELE
ncbi:MAG: carbohydrate ABC transporter substrate-binding protein [Clostridia bacterium]|nr:carbohydrate ABC transporter substrate-binding protein [Clostridia bacterium]